LRTWFKVNGSPLNRMWLQVYWHGDHVPYIDHGVGAPMDFMRMDEFIFSQPRIPLPDIDSMPLTSVDFEQLITVDLVPMIDAVCLDDVVAWERIDTEERWRVGLHEYFDSLPAITREAWHELEV